MASEVRIRPALASDREAIAAFTEHTFDWGDYVADAFDTWLGQPGTRLLVAVDDQDHAVAMSRGRLVSSSEAWFHAARVHPDWRGHGIAGEMAAALREWAAEEGALVGANSLVTPGTMVPAGKLVMGSPARVVMNARNADSK